MASRKTVDAATVRAFLIANPIEGETVGSRGKFSQAQIDRFNQAPENRNVKFTHNTHKPTRKVTTVVVSESGRKVPRTMNVNLPEVRKAAQDAGYPLGDRGRIPAPVMEAFVAGSLPALVASLAASE